MSNSVRLTTLKLADLLMEKFPDIFLSVTDHIIPNFMVMVNKAVTPALAQAQASSAVLILTSYISTLVHNVFFPHCRLTATTRSQQK